MKIDEDNLAILEIIDQDDEFDNIDTQKDIFILFKLGLEEYAIDICDINEIVGMQKITMLPDMPDYLIGVINLRGKIFPLIDLRKRFLMPSVTYNERTCIIITNHEDTKIGLIVDEVTEVMNIPVEQIDPPFQINNNMQQHIKGIAKTGDRVIVLLNVSSILKFQEIIEINSKIN